MPAKILPDAQSPASILPAGFRSVTVDDRQTVWYLERHTAPFAVKLTNRLMGGHRISRPMQECLFAAAVLRRAVSSRGPLNTNCTHFQF